MVKQATLDRHLQTLLPIVERSPGIVSADLAKESGYTQGLVVSIMQRLADAGLVFRTSAGGTWHYYTTESRAVADRARVMQNADQASRSRWRSDSVCASVPKTPQAKKAKSFWQTDAANPRNVKPTICPTFVDKRFAVEPGFERVITADWMLRRQREIANHRKGSK